MRDANYELVESKMYESHFGAMLYVKLCGVNMVCTDWMCNLISTSSEL